MQGLKAIVINFGTEFTVVEALTLLPIEIYYSGSTPDAHLHDVPMQEEHRASIHWD